MFRLIWCCADKFILISLETVAQCVVRSTTTRESQIMNFKVLKIVCILLTVNCLWVRAHLIFHQSVPDSDVDGGDRRTGLFRTITKITTDFKAGTDKMIDSVSGIFHSMHKHRETKVEPVLQESTTEPVPIFDVRITFADEEENAERNDEPGAKTTTDEPETATDEIKLDDRALFDAPLPCPPHQRMAKDGHCRKVQS